MKVNVDFFDKKTFVLSQFQVFLRAEMHILIFPTVLLLVPPSAACGPGKGIF